MFVLDMPGEVIRSSQSPLTCGGVQTGWVGAYNPHPRCAFHVSHLTVADQVTFPGESLTDRMTHIARAFLFFFSLCYICVVSVECHSRVQIPT